MHITQHSLNQHTNQSILVQSETNKTHAYIAVTELLLRHQLGERIRYVVLLGQ
jgi:hypothetical protein